MDEDIFDDELGIDDLADQFLKDLKSEDTAEDEEEEEAEEADTEEEVEEEETSDEAPEDGDEEEDEEAAPAAEVADDAEVSVKVDGKDLKLKVGDLKRLAGQEAALTQKSQSVANQLRAVEAQGLYLANVLEGRLKTAKAKFDKYANVDLFKAQRDLDPEDFDALRAAKAAAEAEYSAVTRESQEFMHRVQETRQKVLRERAAVALKEITRAIPEWNDELYGKVRTYAVSQGMNPNEVNEVVNPAAIIMMNKAMQFDAIKAKTETVEKKVKKSPKRVTPKSAKTVDATSSKFRAAQRKAEVTGDIDAVTDLFLAARKQ